MEKYCSWGWDFVLQIVEDQKFGFIGHLVGFDKIGFTGRPPTPTKMSEGLGGGIFASIDVNLVHRGSCAIYLCTHAQQ